MHPLKGDNQGSLHVRGDSQFVYVIGAGPPNQRAGCGAVLCLVCHEFLAHDVYYSEARSGSQRIIMEENASPERFHPWH